MTKDFSKYKSIIDEFNGQVTCDDFEARYMAATKSLPKTDRFLLKMELKRLAAPCTRLIDLRGHVDGECRPYDHDGRMHYLDDIAIREFEDKVQVYGDYTFGVYEAVLNTENNFRVIYQREKEKLTQQNSTTSDSGKVFEKKQYPASYTSFGPYFNRSEERMNFAVAVKVTLDESIMVDATSSDISVNGCKFRLAKPIDLPKRKLIKIRFVGLEGDFQFGKEESFVYEVRNSQIIDGLQLVGCQRVYSADEARDGFRQFLTAFIQGNKRRYKVNLDNTISALNSRSFAHFVLPKSNELPIFMEDKAGSVKPRYALTCHNSQAVYQYWLDEKRRSTLDYLVTTERLLRLKTFQKDNRPLLVYSFIHTSQGKSYFYTADTFQLANDPLFKAQFLGFAANKPSFAIHQLVYSDINPDDGYSPLTLANTLAKKDQHLNQTITSEVQGYLANLTMLVVASRIHSQDIANFYSGLPFEDINTAKLKNFGHKRSAEPLVVDDVGINFNNQRQEPRFKYKTPAVVSSQDVSWNGASVDFSTSGLKLQMEKSVVIMKGDIVEVTFPQLQKITSAFELKGLPYEVMRVNKAKTILNLRVFVEKHQHIGRSFFKALIEKNREKLTPDEYAMLSPGLARALRNIYSRSSQVMSLIVQTSGSRYKIEQLTCNTPINEHKLLRYCKQFSERVNHVNLYPLLSNLQATSLMHSTLKKLQPDDFPIVDTLYISINPDNEIVDQAITTKLESELKSDILKKMFISRALKRGEFFCMQVMLSRTDEPDMQHLNPELSYISSYAIHRAKQLEQEIWSVAGVVQVFDITQEALNRYAMM